MGGDYYDRPVYRAPPAFTPPPQTSTTFRAPNNSARNSARSTGSTGNRRIPRARRSLPRLFPAVPSLRSNDIIRRRYSRRNNRRRSSRRNSNRRRSSRNVRLHSKKSHQAMTKTKKLHPSCDPRRYSKKMLKTTHKNPIVFALDVTGSMGKWSKIIYDKLPLFYGEMMMQKYCDPTISWIAVGDAGKGDMAPLQVTDFAQGRRIDDMISKIWLEGKGGGNCVESFGLATLFCLSRYDISECDIPFLFITGDEGCYYRIKREWVKKVIGFDPMSDISTERVFKEIKHKFHNNVYILKKPYGFPEKEEKITNQWIRLLGEDHVIQLKDPKSIVDISLGIIAISNGKRTLEEYLENMKDRGQTNERVLLVREALKDKIRKNPMVDVVEQSKKKRKEEEEFEGEEDEDEEDPVFISVPKYEFDPSSILWTGRKTDEKKVGKGNHIKKNETKRKKKKKKKKVIFATSYGIIPLRRRNRKYEVLVLKHENGGHWDFPKGHGREGKKTAEKELKEETNLEVKRYLTNETFTKKYTIKKYDDCVVHKTVHWFVCEVGGNVKVQEKEILESRWVGMDEAVQMLSFDSQKRLFTDVRKRIVGE